LLVVPSYSLSQVVARKVAVEYLILQCQATKNSFLKNHYQTIKCGSI
jgi:hypothetical protein